MFSGETLSLAESAKAAVPASVLFVCISTALMVLRLHCLLRRLGCPSTIRAQASIAFPGLLAQQIGSEVAFDLMRFLGAKKQGGKPHDILAALFMDRLLGMVSLTAVTAFGLALVWKGNDWIFAVGVTVLVSVAVPVGLWLWQFAFERFPVLRKMPGAGFVESLGKSMWALRRAGILLIGLFLLSVGVQLAFLGALYCCSHAFVHAVVSPDEALAAGALSSFTTAVPFPMAGLGIGEAAFGEVVVRMRESGNAADFAPVFLLNRVVVLGVGIVSWIVVLCTGGRPPDHNAALKDAQ
jgi:Uncharacterised protein family (UPF0104).